MSWELLYLKMQQGMPVAKGPIRIGRDLHKRDAFNPVSVRRKESQEIRDQFFAASHNAPKYNLTPKKHISRFYNVK